MSSALCTHYFNVKQPLIDGCGNDICTGYVDGTTVSAGDGRFQFVLTNSRKLLLLFAYFINHEFA